MHIIISITFIMIDSLAVDLVLCLDLQFEIIKSKVQNMKMINTIYKFTPLLQNNDYARY